MIEDSNYHRILRVSVVACAAVLLFESGLISESTIRMSQDTHMYVANSVGASADVEPNEFALISGEPTTQKHLLKTEGQVTQGPVYIVASLLFILLTLLILNYTLDYLRARKVRRKVGAVETLQNTSQLK